MPEACQRLASPLGFAARPRRSKRTGQKSTSKSMLSLPPHAISWWRPSSTSECRSCWPAKKNLTRGSTARPTPRSHGHPPVWA